MFNQNIFELIRERIQLVDLVARFTDLKPSAGKLKGSCPLPNHQDSTPSFYVYNDGHVHCFGCGFHGDAIDFWAAVKGLQPGMQAAFELAGEYNIKLPLRDAEIDRSSEHRRQQEAGYLKRAQECHSALVRNPQVADWWDRRGFNEELRSDYLLGSTEDGSAAIIPFWHLGRIQGLIRRKLRGEPKYVLQKAEDFAGGHRPLFIPNSLHGDVHEVEGYVDALALAALGFSAFAVGGTGISDKQRAELDHFKGSIFIFPDADESGAKASLDWVNYQYPRARLCPSEYGDGRTNKKCKDVADLFQAWGDDAKEILEQLKARATDALDLALSEAPVGTRERYRHARDHALPLLLRLKDQGERAAALDEVTQKLGLKGDSKRLLKSELKSQSESDSQGDTTDEVNDSGVPQPGSDRYRDALELLKNPKLLLRFVIATRRLGHVGEFKLKVLAFICAISARMGHPIQPSTHAQSSAGKNALWDTVLSLFPPEMVIRRSGLSAKALFRTQVNLKGAILYIQEMAGSEAAEYTIRVLQSDGRLEYEATEKARDGSLRNVVYATEGPTVIVQTTTKNHLHSENETRVFPLYVDESEKQTERIVQTVLKEAAGGGIADDKRNAILRLWRDAIRLLTVGDVVIPFAERIKLPSTLVRVRRDVRRLIDVVKVIAWLHQYQRERDYANRIIATEEDFTGAVTLVRDSLSRAWQTLTPAEEKVLKTIQNLSSDQQTTGFRRRDLKVPGVSDSRLKEVLKSLSDTYLDCDGRRGPQGYTYTVARNLEEPKFHIYLTGQSPDYSKTTGNKDIMLDENASSDSAQSSDLTFSESGSPPPDDIGRQGFRPINNVYLQKIESIERSAELNLDHKILTASDAGPSPALSRNDDNRITETTNEMGSGPLEHRMTEGSAVPAGKRDKLVLTEKTVSSRSRRPVSEEDNWPMPFEIHRETLDDGTSYDMDGSEFPTKEEEEDVSWQG